MPVLGKGACSNSGLFKKSTKLLSSNKMCRMATVMHWVTCRPVFELVWPEALKTHMGTALGATGQNRILAKVKSTGSGVRLTGCQLSDLGWVMWPHGASVPPFVNMSRFFIKKLFFKNAFIHKHFTWFMLESSYKHKLNPHLLSIYCVLGTGIKSPFLWRNVCQVEKQWRKRFRVNIWIVV